MSEGVGAPSGTSNRTTREYTVEHLIIDVVASRTEGDILHLDPSDVTQTCLACAIDPAQTHGPCPLDASAAAQRPDWRTMSALAFTSTPTVTQPAMFATGTDRLGTPSLLDAEDEHHLF
ncbi:hypothetical protein [Streptacidiphilus sp. EB129]|uniref:hypothetical protein n=1 Tax=Streptacidiphilus sp. EB129 TaxID=3156262 RepID=UPI0035188964